LSPCNTKEEIKLDDCSETSYIFSSSQFEIANSEEEKLQRFSCVGLHYWMAIEMASWKNKGRTHPIFEAGRC